MDNNVIDVQQIYDLLFGRRTNISRLAKLTGVNENTYYSYTSGTTPFESMPLSMAIKLSKIANDSTLSVQAKKMPPGITAHPLRQGGYSYQVQINKHRHKIELGTYTTVNDAIAARNEYILTHRSQINVIKKARPIDATSELIDKVKATRGVGFYKDRNHIITGFRAEYMRDGKRVYLGKFDTFEKAKEAYDNDQEQKK